MRRNYHGIKYYSSTDLSCGDSLEKAAAILETFNQEEDFSDINRAIEFFNIKQFFDCNIHLKKWDDTVILRYTDIVNKTPQLVATFFSGINNQNFIQYFDEIAIDYIDDFWELISYYKVYQRISEEVFSQALENHNIGIFHILKQKSIVNTYGQIITNFMKKNPTKAVELLINNFLTDNSASQNKLQFPKELTGDLKETILLEYINSNEANPNYLRIIAESQSLKELPLQDKTRLAARKKFDDYLKSSFSENSGTSFAARVVFSNTQTEEVIYSNNSNNNVSISYSVKWIKENQDYPTLLNNFIYLFEYVDIFSRSRFVSQPAEMGVFERFMGLKGKKHYITGIHFAMNHMIFNLQMTGYCRELSRLNINLESIFKWFFETYLCEEFSVTGFIFNASSSGTTELEKSKLLASEIDSILKQYTLYVSEGHIDRELFEISSAHIIITDIPSFCQEKYVYPISVECNGCMNLLFSDQSGLAYTEKTQDDGYMNFFSLLQNEVMSIEDFFEHQKPMINWLSQHGCINIAENGILSFNLEKVDILRDLYYHQVSCLQYLDRYRTILDDMVRSGEIQYCASLFTEPEAAYLNYILNKAEFSNGKDLRNKYIHGTHSLQPEDHRNDYIELLKIMVLIVIKINEEFCFREEQAIK